MSADDNYSSNLKTICDVRSMSSDVSELSVGSFVGGAGKLREMLGQVVFRVRDSPGGGGRGGTSCPRGDLVSWRKDSSSIVYPSVFSCPMTSYLDSWEPGYMISSLISERLACFWTMAAETEVVYTA